MNSCIAGADRREVLEALSNQLVVTDGAESKRHIKVRLRLFMVMSFTDSLSLVVTSFVLLGCIDLKFSTAGGPFVFFSCT